MPRIDQSLIRKAFKISPYLPVILQATRCLPSAINELRWLKNHVQNIKPALCEAKAKLKLYTLVKRRACGEPLQYILGSQPFGDLDIKCKRGVLIPRPETEAYTIHLANLIKSNQLHPSITETFSQKKFTPKEGGRQYPPKIRILDACSGTGAITLLLCSALLKKETYSSDILILGIDISPKAVNLARENLCWNKNLGHLPNFAGRNIRFEQRDIFEDYHRGWDIIVSNPPYISHSAYDHEINRSVRNFEPKIALVPPVPKISFRAGGHPEDIFFERLIHMHEKSVSKVLLMEISDVAQAIRVVNIIDKYERVRMQNRVEFWRDFPDGKSDNRNLKMVNVGSMIVKIKGVGKVRSVILIRKDSAIPKSGKDYKIKHVQLTNIIRTKPQEPKRQLYGPPELKGTWKYLNSPASTDGRATLAMGRGWGSQRKSLVRIKANKLFQDKLKFENQIQARNAIEELERPIKSKRATQKRGNFSLHTEPFLMRHFRSLK
ncbi:Mitochondrial MRF1 N(5)-glutamine methyltransferase MTQ1 [Erysiphe necator]|nr:Mitochondrial MRF1 N(5)-glutamine methyltransferase MTQ1 [Erysiphe necator]